MLLWKRHNTPTSLGRTVGPVLGDLGKLLGCDDLDPERLGVDDLCRRQHPPVADQDDRRDREDHEQRTDQHIGDSEVDQVGADRPQAFV